MEGDHPLSYRPLQHHGHAPLLYPFSGFSPHIGPGMHQEEPQLLQVSIEFYGKGGCLAIPSLLRSWAHSRGSLGCRGQCREGCHSQGACAVCCCCSRGYRSGCSIAHRGWGQLVSEVHSLGHCLSCLEVVERTSQEL